METSMYTLPPFNVYLFILPMRNGNDEPESIYEELLDFLSYLWGMET